MWTARVIETTTIDGRGSQQETVAEIEPAISTIAGSLVSIGTISQTQPRYVSNICSAILYIFFKLKLFKKCFHYLLCIGDERCWLRYGTHIAELGF